MPEIEMFFDMTCPYCDRGYALLKSLLPAYPEANILWRPIEAHPRVEEPNHRPYADLLVQGAMLVRAQGGDERAYYDRMFDAVFRENNDVEDVETLASLAAALGHDRSAFRAALTVHAYEKSQRAANDYAYDRKSVWAVPTLVCGSLRLDAAEGRGITTEGLEEFLAACCKK